MTSSNIFAREVAKTAVSQICIEMGYIGTQKGALDILADLLQRYIESIGESSHNYSEMAGRTESNFLDVRQALKDMGVSISDLHNFASTTEELPFAKNIPEFPNRKYLDKRENPEGIESNSKETNSMDIEPPRPANIPPHLPSLPQPHTFIQTPVYPKRIVDPRQLRKKKSQEKRQVQEALASLNEKLGTKPMANYDATRKAPSEVNPFLAAPKTAKIKKEEEARKAQSVIPPTPVQRDSHYMKQVMGKKAREQEDRAHPEEKRVYSELEESERAKKRQRAEQLLSIRYENSMPVELQPTSQNITFISSSLKSLQHGNNNNVHAGPVVEKI